MNRRQFVGSLAGVGSALALAGCSGDGGSTTPTDTATDTRTPTDTATATRTPTDKPGGIYIQTFQERMSMQGTATTGRYRFALMFAVPHDFWTVTGNTVSATTADPEDSLHLMAQVWDAETGTVLPETGLSVEITRDGELISEEVIYPMLSQPMSFHYGGNFALPGDGSYTVTLSVGGTPIRRTGAFAGAFGDPASVEIPLEFTQATRDRVNSRPLERGGKPGALRPMDMAIPQAVLPAEADLPGTVRGSAMTDDARFVVTTFDDAGRVDADGRYLAASARTRYNRYVLPAMAVDATLERGGETVYEGPLQRTLSPDLGYHYGAAVDGVQSGDELTLSVPTIPQVARHEGYETAFRQMDDVAVTL
jgi:hypothetical protein